MRHVFVYGTLRAGEANDIGQAAARNGIAAPTLLGAAALPGELYDFGTYPGMVPGPAGRSLVWGDVYEIDERLVPVLDEIERVYPGVDTLFRQEPVTVELGGRAYACVYYPVAAHAAADRPRIVSGDWVQHRREREAAAASA
ncbi:MULTISPECIES: gamma-glutamylcyclotransferase [unclassified Burkholderia]|uniref:gamma-glutamylcyclotransferase family protein n=1 Tax=unclassified Burkholderia TaxID=2613784 RepID=UPI000F56764B|nr:MULTISPECIES: gamma-glutamylcyclotransferase family protein [unclassified Burkholderia]RQR77510.1 gamma-glutamylcyclotransferase [Burkholderia sp. Bp9015]RQR84709.1 gamma-glutamylcyclotransferase [Burkholderia sp. Bp9011]RQR94430.1 gamma-glutamylcyclotransferase [Burkholderia sp. Bp8994]RQR94665.1 gamma-glutamylcyclotransferase [Burkholderia sp. Bp9010]RQS15255.1 gamma-glutamylcyclotransferase [Burkholderia sp. Bp8991]